MAHEPATMYVECCEEREREIKQSGPPRIAAILDVKPLSASRTRAHIVNSRNELQSKAYEWLEKWTDYMWL